MSNTDIGRIMSALALAVLSPSCVPRDSHANGGTSRWEPTATARSQSSSGGLLREIRKQRAEVAERALKQGDYEIAVREFRDLVSLEPERLFWRASLARAYEASGRAMEAFQTWRAVMNPGGKSVSSYHSDARVLAHYGDLCLSYGTRSEAVEAYRAAVADKHSTFPPGITLHTSNGSLSSLRAAAHFAAVEAYRAVGDDKAALSELEKLELQMPSSGMVRAALAFQLLRFGDLRKASDKAEAAIKLASGSERKGIITMAQKYGLVKSKVFIRQNLDGSVTTGQTTVGGEVIVHEGS